MSFQDCLAEVLKHEGGVSHDPDDPGGLTNRGVTQKAYDAYRAKKQQTPKLVTELTLAEIMAFYQEEYWTPIKGDQLPHAVALVVFDSAVNQGVGYATKLLQWAVRVPQDGDIGPVTLAAVAAQDPEELAQTLLWGRMMRYLATCRRWKQVGKPNPYKFIDGWIIRLDRVRMAAKLGPTTWPQ